MLSGAEYDFRQGCTGGKGHIAWGSCRIGPEWVQAGYAPYSLGGYRIGPGGRIAGYAPYRGGLGQTGQTKANQKTYERPEIEG